MRIIIEMGGEQDRGEVARLVERLRTAAVPVKIIGDLPMKPWPVPVLGEKPMPSDKSQNIAFEKSLRDWTIMTWDHGLRDFNVEIAENNPQKPVWPREPFQAFLKLAFAGRIIDSDDHEYVRQLRGISA